MIKVVGIVRRRADLSVAQFQDYWRERHAALVVTLPGLLRYVQSHTRPSGYRSRTPACDGVAELWFEDTTALRALEGTPQLRAVRDDEDAFIDRSAYREILTEDVIIKDGPVPAGGVKNIELVTRKPGMPPVDFHRYWERIHGPLGASIPQVMRYVQSHTRAGAYRDGNEPALDGVALTWFEDTGAMRAAATTREYAATRADEENFVAAHLDFVITTEHVIVA